MFELSHRLIGIYKTANATQSTFSPAFFHSARVAEVVLGVAIDNHALVPTKVVTPVTASTA